MIALVNKLIKNGKQKKYYQIYRISAQVIKMCFFFSFLILPLIDPIRQYFLTKVQSYEVHTISNCRLNWNRLNCLFRLIINLCHFTFVCPIFVLGDQNNDWYQNNKCLWHNYKRTIVVLWLCHSIYIWILKIQDNYFFFFGVYQLLYLIYKCIVKCFKFAFFFSVNNR